MSMAEIHEASKKARILIVDDKPENVLLLQKLLEHEGYTALYTTTDPTQVVDLYHKWRFDLILLDIRMPHMSGFDVMDALSDVIREDYLPVIVLTAQTDAETRLKAIEHGAKDFVTKPFDRNEVLNRIRNLLEVRILFNRQRWEREILDAKVRERTQQLYDTQLEIIRRLGRAGEYRDNETGMHVIRMSKGCQRLALAAGMDELQAERLLHASPMHDVGKIGIPDRILLKPGKLDAEEWEIMKSHVDIGANILAEHSSEMMELARTVILNHHEKWDGSGYPRGFKGDAIPVEGRIAALCDVFDALTSVRPYKEAWSVEKATDFMKGQSGQHFDPDLTTLFMEILPDILKIRDDYADDPDEVSHLTLTAAPAE